MKKLVIAVDQFPENPGGHKILVIQEKSPSRPPIALGKEVFSQTQN
jgi:hypothetical protein